MFSRSASTARKGGPFVGTDKRAFAFCPPGSMQAGLVALVTHALVINVPVVGSATLGSVDVGLPLNDIGGALGRDLAVTTSLNG